MSRTEVRRVGSGQGVCRRCGELALLTLWELRPVQRWWRRRSASAPMARSVSCPLCVTTYAVRRTSLIGSAPARRRDEEGEPGDRDWSYRAAPVPTLVIG